jgi:anthranilate/para-aminobenzoate synthase component I
MLRKTVAIPESLPMTKTEAKSEFGEDNFKAAVKKAQHYILEGDIMQVVLSQRMSQDFDCATAIAVPCFAQLKSIALYVLLRHGRSPCGGRIARNFGAFRR